MLKSIEIKGFKAIQNICLDELSHINYLIGPNSSGKSSILQCFQYIRACEWQPDGSLTLNCGTKKDAGQTLTYFKKDFSFKIQESVVLDLGEYKKSDAVLEINGPPAIENEILKFIPAQYKPYTISDPNNADKGKFQDFFKHNYNTKYIDTHNTNFRIEIIRSPQEYWSISTLNRNESLLETIVDDINYVSEELLGLGYTISSNQYGEFLRSDDLSPIYLGEISSGIRTLAVIRHLLRDSIKTNSGIIMIEEPETSLHPNLQKDFPGILEKIIDSAFEEDNSKIQFLITTHSPFILSGTRNLPERLLNDKPLLQKVYLLNNGKNAEEARDNTGKKSSQILSQASELLGAAFDDLLGNYNNISLAKKLAPIKFIFVEGREAATFEDIFKSTDSSIFCIPSEGLINCIGNYYSLKLHLVKMFGDRVKVFAIIDRSCSRGIYVGQDHIPIKTESPGPAFSDSEVTLFNQHHKGEAIYMLSRREIENYLYDLSVVKEAFEGETRLLESYTNWLSSEFPKGIELEEIKDRIKLQKQFESIYSVETKLSQTKAFKDLIYEEIKEFLTIDDQSKD